MHRTLLAGALLALAPAPRLEAQQATSSPAADRPIPGWLVLGTFPADTGALRLDRDYLGGETTAAPAPGDRVGDRPWRTAASDGAGRLDFNDLLEAPLERAAAYAVAYIVAPADRTVSLALESDDDAKAWLNGRLVYRAEVARGIGRADTVTVRLARGVNRLLVKVLNRSGGFGVGARVLALGPDPIADLALPAARPAGALAGDPAPWVTLSPARLAAQARLEEGELRVDLTMDVARWGGVSDPVRVSAGRQSHVVPPSPGGLPVQVTLAASWPELAALIAEPSVHVRWGRRDVTVPFPLRAGDLLGVLSRTITAAWDTAADTLRLRTRVPAVLAGLTVSADVAEFVPGGTFRVNGRAAVPDAAERLVVCAPCAAGEELSLEVLPGSDEWWDAPRLRVEETGWRELSESARLARLLAADSTIPLLAEESATVLLPLALRPDKRGYLAELERLRAPLRGYEAVAAMDTLDLIGNSHIDAAWLWRWPETVEVVRNTWRTAVKLLDKYPEMRFAASSAKYYTWLEQYEPALLARIQELAREGRWVVTGGWWVEPDVNTPAGESLVRQGLYGQRTITRLFGEPATVGWIPDTFGYPWTLPQLMSGAGLTSFVTQKLRWNEGGWSADRNFFWWEGPDGTRIPTYIPFGYDHDLRAERLAQEWRTQQDSAATGRVLTLYGVGDHGGGPTMEMLDRRRDAARVPVMPVLRDVDPAGSLATMVRTATDTPVIRDELYFEYHRGVQTSQAAMKQWNRRMEAALLAAEAASVAVLAAPAPRTPAVLARAAVRDRGTDATDYPRTDLTRAWEMTLFNQFHDILPGSSIGGVYVDALADYRVADSLVQGALSTALARLGARLDTRPPLPDAIPYIVFNPSAMARTELVAFPAGADRARVLDRRRRLLPAHVRGDSVIARVEVPALSARVVFVVPGGAVTTEDRPDARVLENEWLRVEIDSLSGSIARLYDRRLGREVLAAGAQGNVLMTMPDTPKDWDAWNVDHTDGPWTAVDSAVTVGRVGRTPLGDELTVLRMRPDVHAQQRYFLPRHSARLDVASTITWQASHQLLKAVFPLAVAADSVWAEIPYGAIARVSTPRTRADSLKFELPMQRWIDASQGGWGVSLVNDAKHGYDVRGDTLRLSLLRAPKYPDPDADMGTHRFTYSIVPHAGDWRSGPTFAAADALNRPFRVQRADPHPGARELAPPLVLAGDGVELGALKLAEDGESWIVRLVERHGRAATARLAIAGATAWRYVDLLERPAGEWQGVARGSLEVPVGAWKIVTLEVRR